MFNMDQGKRATAASPTNPTFGGILKNAELKSVSGKRYICFLIIIIAAMLILSFSSFNPFNIFEKVEYFPVKTEPVYATAELSLKGKLVLQDGCIRLAPVLAGIVPYPVKSYLPLWPYGYSWRKSGLRFEILDTDGRIVARVGDIKTIVGAEWPEAAVNSEFDPQLLKTGLGPFWFVSAIK